MSYKVSSICMKVMAVLCFLLFLQPVSAQYNWDELDDNLELKKKQLGNNLIAMIWKGDSLLYKNEIGEFNSKTQAPIASCSQWLTTALVMQFVDEGKITLDDPVVRYVPEFGKYFKSYITIGQCLSHTTGIDDESGPKKFSNKKKYESLEEEVNAIAARKIRANAGTDFWYGNIGINIAGRVLEVVSKKKFETLIKTKLLNPLGMRRTTFTDLEGNPVNPSGGAQSTGDDYMKFLVMLLNKGKHNGVQILKEESVKKIMSLQTKPELMKYVPKAAEGFGYAMGSWVTEQDADGNAKAVMIPGLTGCTAIIDYCRGYACLIFVKTLLKEEKAEAQEGLKNIIDHQVQTECRQ